MTQEQFEKILPDFLKDFHDQKDFFKGLHSLYSEGENKIPNNWVDNHIYTIDFFLWFMARHGYRLQRFKSKHFEQYNIYDFIKEQNEKRIASLSKIFSSPVTPTP